MGTGRKYHMIVLRTAAVLLVLVMLSTSIVAGRYARYTTTASGNDSARVAKFLITETGTVSAEIKATLRPGDEVDFSIQVTNGSEVTVNYSITAANVYNNLPLTISLMDGTQEVQNIHLAPGKTREMKLRVKWTGEASNDLIGHIDLIRLTVTAIQVD